MFLLQHKCSDLEPVAPYAVSVGVRSIGGGIAVPITRVSCPKCRDEFYVIGHDTFGKMRPAESDRPDGMIIRAS